MQMFNQKVHIITPTPTSSDIFVVVCKNEDDLKKLKKICDETLHKPLQPKVILTQSTTTTTSICEDNQKQLRKIQKSQFRAQQKNMRFKNK